MPLAPPGKAVSRLSGVSPHTLRAWERRYGVVEPNRSLTGRRIYSMADVEKLSLLHKLTQLGHSIGNLAPLEMKELSSLDGHFDRQLASARETSAPIFETAQAGRKIIIALRALDFDEVDRQILQARLATPVRSFVLEVAAPLMQNALPWSEHSSAGFGTGRTQHRRPDCGFRLRGGRSATAGVSAIPVLHVASLPGFDSRMEPYIQPGRR